MTREEFEAVLAIEGKYIKMELATYGGRHKKHAMFKAAVWEWVEPNPYHAHMYMALYGKIPEWDMLDGKMKYTIGKTHWEPTNHKAIKHLILAWEKGLF